MAYYTYTYDSTSVTITARGLTSGDNVSFYCRLTSETTAEVARLTSTGTTCIHTFTGLSPNTSYTINIHVNSVNVGAQSFVTPGITPKGGFYIYYNSQWRKATPFIYDGVWKKVNPYVYDGGWKG